MLPFFRDTLYIYIYIYIYQLSVKDESLPNFGVEL